MFSPSVKKVMRIGKTSMSSQTMGTKRISHGILRSGFNFVNSKSTITVYNKFRSSVGSEKLNQTY